MSHPSDITGADEAPVPAPARLPWLRLFYWTVRREIWEHRAVYMAPIAAALLGVFGVLLSSGHTIAGLKAAIADPKKTDLLMMPYAVVCFAVMVTGLVFAGFYAIGALHGERRDRSILFWKSLPVSDLTTVLAKAFVPLMLLPPMMLAVAVGGHLMVLILSGLVVMLAGFDPRELWGRLHIGFLWAAYGRGMLFLPLWYAPIVGWLMLVSAWARRMPILWAAAPFIGVGIVEAMMFGKQGGLITAVLAYRLAGWFTEAFSVGGKGKTPIDSWADLDPTPFLTNPHVWGGLVVAAVFFAAAVRLRRQADTI
jgi:ABC-2 type transport system permease protein